MYIMLTITNNSKSQDNLGHLIQKCISQFNKMEKYIYKNTVESLNYAIRMSRDSNI